MEQIAIRRIAERQEKQKKKRRANQARLRDRLKAKGKRQLQVLISTSSHGVLRRLVDKYSSSNARIIEQAIASQLKFFPVNPPVVTSGPFIGNTKIAEWVDESLVKALLAECGDGKRYRDAGSALTALIIAFGSKSLVRNDL